MNRLWRTLHRGSISSSYGQLGTSGNQNIANYQYLAPMKNSNTHYLFGTGGYNEENAAKELATNWGAISQSLSQ
jgi:hypothetical protein